MQTLPNGNGVIADNGNAKLSVGGAGFWPGMEGNVTATAENTCSGNCEVTGNAGLMRRGGNHLTTSTALAIAYRSPTVTGAAVRDSQYGGRGCAEAYQRPPCYKCCHT
ncbi:MAG: hypothetical protein JWQ09_4559 [Segetibacter sp.]|nr:hypothetical protein [Segetibacter sp.]